MAQGLDYSFSHPDEACAARAGYSFVARYIGDLDPNSAKYLDAPELALIRAAGLSVVAARETTAGFMLTDSGAAHALASRAHCDQLGLFGIPIYYALDVDPRGLSGDQIAAVTRFLQDAAAADGGGHNVGIYGSDDAIDRWARQPFCWWGWQTYAWSAGRISPRAHFRQYLNGQTVCGGTVDLNETYAADFGQWPRPQEADLLPDERAALFAIKAQLDGPTPEDGDRLHDLWVELVATHNAVLATGAVDEAAVAAAVAEQVLAVLTPAIASGVANELHARLAG